MVLQQYENAIACFDRIGTNAASAQLLAEASVFWLSAKNGNDNSLRLLLKAIKVAFDHQIDIAGTGVALIVKSFLNGMDNSTKTNMRAAEMATVVRATLKRCNYTI